MRTRTLPWPIPLGPVSCDERADLAAAQAAEQQLYRTSIDALDDVFLVVDPDGRMVRWNDRLRAVTGHDDDALASACWSKVVGFEDGRTCADILAEALSSGKLAVDGWLRSPGGRRIPYRWAVAVHAPVEDARPLLCMAGRDVTERIESERRLGRAIEAALGDPGWIARGILDRFFAEADDEPETVGLHELTRREVEVLERLARGWSNGRIAADLGLAQQTIRNYVKTIYDKLQVRARAEAVVWARKRGLGLV